MWGARTAAKSASRRRGGHLGSWHESTTAAGASLRAWNVSWSVWVCGRAELRVGLSVRRARWKRANRIEEKKVLVRESARAGWRGGTQRM